MAMTKRGPVYYADLRDLDGGRQSLFTRDEAVARTLYLRVEKLALKGRKVDPRAVKKVAKTLRNGHLATARLGMSTGGRRAGRAEWRVVFSGAKHSPVLDIRNRRDCLRRSSGHASA